MSRRAVSSDLEGIDRVSRRGRTDIGFEAVAAHYVDGTIKQACDVFLEAGIVEHGEMRLWIDVDHDVDIAVRTARAACHRAEHSRPAHAARAEIRFESTQGFKRFGTVETQYSTKSRSAGEIGALTTTLLPPPLSAAVRPCPVRPGERMAGRRPVVGVSNSLAAPQHPGDAQVFVEFGPMN